MGFRDDDAISLIGRALPLNTVNCTLYSLQEEEYPRKTNFNLFPVDYYIISFMYLVFVYIWLLLFYLFIYKTLIVYFVTRTKQLKLIN